MKITCKHCGIVDKPHKCPHKKYYSGNREDKKVYRKGIWQRTRDSILEEYNYQCLWNLYVEGVSIEANEVHHIIELLEDESLAYDKDNLIPLELYNHKLVHKLYKSNKQRVQQLLRLMLKSYKEGDFTLGKYKDFLK